MKSNMTFEEFLSKFDDDGLTYFNHHVLFNMDLQEVCSVLRKVGILHLYADTSVPGDFKWKRIIDNNTRYNTRSFNKER